MRKNKFKTIIAGILVLALCMSLGIQQWRLTEIRNDLGYDKTIISPETPPLIVLTTVALGGFKGLFVDILWLQLIDLCKREQYFKVIPISNWIITLQPNFSSVWVFNSWNLAFNISVQFISAEDRWGWVKKALEMLKEKGLHYNPRNPRIYREIAWITLMRLCKNQDVQHIQYKQIFMQEISDTFNACGLNPITLETQDKALATETLRVKLSLDLGKMRAINAKYGPFDWRLPDAHALYWAQKSLDLSKDNKDFKSSKIIQDALKLSFIRGRIATDDQGNIRLFPNPAMFDITDKYFIDTIEMYTEKDGKQTFKNAHSLMLQNAAFFLNGIGLKGKAHYAFNSLIEKYPGRTSARTFDEFIKSFESSAFRFVKEKQ